MTINKMTLAAALSIGLLASSVSISAATIDDITGMNLAACPITGCKTKVTPHNAKCPKCMQPKENCTCNPCECDPCGAAPCDPCVKPCDPCANPCNEPCDPCSKKKKKCDPCKKEKCNPCECDPCGAAPAPCDCPPMATCPNNGEPTCAVCPNTSNLSDSQRQQIYAYPYAVYGGNNVVGEYNNGIAINESPYAPCPSCATSHIPCENALSAITDGIPIARSECDPCGAAPCNTCDPCASKSNSSFSWLNPFNVFGTSKCKTSCSSCNTGCSTGQACQLPVVTNTCNSCGCGVPVVQNNCGCPVQIQTQTSMDVCKKSLEPFTMSQTGAAAPLMSVFPDVPSGYWAGCEINRLAENDIIVGYPDRTFKPSLPVSRAELASMTIKGFNLNDNMTCPQTHFKDVPKNHWANKIINKAVANGLMCGYPNNMFKPNETVSRAEALTILSKGINCDMTDCQAREILSQYCDGNNVPSWAAIGVAKSLQAGVLANSPQPKNINPNNDASRADIASMLQSVRVAIGYDTQDKVTLNDGCPCENSKAYVEKETTVKVPTLQLCFNDEISAKHANIGDRFAARTVDSVTIDGQCFPAGSVVHGVVTEVIRPTMKCKGGLKLSFKDIQNGKCKVNLPNQIIVAQVNTMKRPNFFAKLVEAPFTWTGGILGNVGRTVGGAIVNAGNAVESVFDGVGVGTGEIFQGQLGAAGRSYVDAIKNTVKAPIDVTRTALSGTMGLFGYTADEITYLVDKNGMRVSSVNPKEQVTISFGCNEQ